MSRASSDEEPEEWPPRQPHHSPFHEDTPGRSSKRRRLHSHRNHGSTLETGLMREGTSHDASRFIGSASGIHFIRTVTHALGRTGDGTRAASNAIGDLVPGEDDQLVEESPGHVESPMSATRAPFWRDDELADSGAVTFDALVAWTQSYFDNWHPLFPFLHGPQILELLERLEQVGIDNVSEADATIVKSLVSISLADSRQMSQYKGPREARLLFLSQGHVASSISFAIGSPASLRGVQAALCVQLFLVSMLRFNMASRLGGIIVRMAFHLGLHRCPFRYAHFSRDEAIMRKRIWWSLYSLERMVCQSLGHPLGIADDDIDVCLPTCELHGATQSNDGDHSHSESQPCPTQSEPSDQSARDADQLIPLTLLAQHARLRGSILELRNKSIAQRNDTLDRAMAVQSELSSWVNLVHEVVSESQDDADDSVPSGPAVLSQAQSTLLSVLQHEATLALNRPLLASRTPSPSCSAALQTCIGSSRAILDIVTSRGFPSQDETVHTAIMIWPLLTWSVWMSCFILVYAALEDSTTRKSALRYATKAQRILEQLSRRGTSWPERCLQAVRHLISVLHLKDQDRSGVRPSQLAGQSLRSSRRSSERANTLTAHNIDRAIHSSPQATFDTIEVASGDVSAQNGTGNTRIHTITDNGNPQTRSRPGMLDIDPSRTLTSFLDTNADTGDEWNQFFADPLSVIDFANFAQDGDARWAFGPETD